MPYLAGLFVFLLLFQLWVCSQAYGGFFVYYHQHLYIIRLRYQHPSLLESKLTKMSCMHILP